MDAEVTPILSAVPGVAEKMFADIRVLHGFLHELISEKHSDVQSAWWLAFSSKRHAECHYQIGL